MINNKEILPSDPLFESSIEEIGKKFRDGSLTCVELTSIYYRRINFLNPKLNAYIYLNENNALSWAQGIDKLFSNGVDLGPLMGIPIAIKDICSVNGMPTTNGSNIISDDITGPEGALVKRLKSLGCIILGKSHTVEFALGATGINKYKGTPRNPWDENIHRMPGGSSSGSAVAVASGLAAFAIGTDTGDRAHRMGQKKPVTYVDINAEDTVDEKIVKALRKKINIASEVLGEQLKSWI